MSADFERDLEELRKKHELRPLTTEEEGAGVDRLPPCVYGFTYSPGTVSAPLFRNRKSENYEIHKLKDGTVVILGYVAEAEAKALARSGEPSAQRVGDSPGPIATGVGPARRSLGEGGSPSQEGDDAPTQQEKPVALRVFPRFTNEAPSLVLVPTHRIRGRREHSQRDGQGLELLVEPG